MTTCLLYSTQFIAEFTNIRLCIYGYCYVVIYIYQNIVNKYFTCFTTIDMIMEYTFHMSINLYLFPNIIGWNIILSIVKIILNYFNIYILKSEDVFRYIVDFLIKYKINNICVKLSQIDLRYILYYSILYDNVNLLEQLEYTYSLYHSSTDYNEYVEFYNDSFCKELLDFLAFQRKCKICFMNNKNIFILTNCGHYCCVDCFYKFIPSEYCYYNCIFCDSQVENIFIFSYKYWIGVKLKYLV